MPTTKAERLARKLGHTKQERLRVKDGEPSINEVLESVPMLRNTSEGVVEYVKHNGILYKKVLDRA
jgi:hypothetical protein|tara:strand:+ start:842 stop:1039 length:198 start_codon:yes stop_codon:yes gene_type:complete